MNPTKLPHEVLRNVVPYLRATWSEHEVTAIPEEHRADPIAAWPADLAEEFLEISAEDAARAGFCPVWRWPALLARLQLQANRPASDDEPERTSDHA